MPIERPNKDVSVHQAPQGGRLRTVVSLQEHLGRHRDVRDTLDARRRAHGDKREEASRGYHPRHGGRYDSGEDRSLSPDLTGPQAFGRRILNVVFPPRYRSSTNILKYFGETNPGLWLKDYWFACQASGVDSDNFIIHNLPLFLSDST